MKNQVVKNAKAALKKGKALAQKQAVAQGPQLVHQMPLIEALNVTACKVRDTDDATVEHYTAIMAEAAEKAEAYPFPPVVAYEIGNELYLVDGWHRTYARDVVERKMGNQNPDIPTTVIYGKTLDDALWYACGANAKHARPLTPSERRDIVRKAAALLDENGHQRSVRQVAIHCGVSTGTVVSVRKGLTPAPTKGANGKTYKPKASKTPKTPQAPKTTTVSDPECDEPKFGDPIVANTNVSLPKEDVKTPEPVSTPVQPVEVPAMVVSNQKMLTHLRTIFATRQRVEWPGLLLAMSEVAAEMNATLTAK